MTVPKLKHIRVSSESELRSWLSKHADQFQEALLVTCGKKSRDKHVTCDQVLDALADHEWSRGRSYTLKGNLIGHVAKRNHQRASIHSHRLDSK